MNPWEQYQDQTQEQGPWNSYGEGNVAMPEKVINEMHPDIPFTVRAVYKNFGADPEASFNYLQKKLPNLQLKKDKEGEVLAKRPEETEWKRLDPKGFDLQDISDIGYDVPAAVAQGAATAAVGLAGGAAGGGVGAIPAAMFTSGVTGAGLEGLRQGIGSMMGIEDNASKEQAILAGAAGTVSPLLFGTGAGAKEAGKYIAKKGLETTSKDLLQTQRGLLGRGYDAAAGYVGPKLAGALGGYRPEVITAASENLPLIKAAKDNPEVAVSLLQEGKEKIISGVKGSLDDTGKAIESLTKELDSQGALIPTNDILKPIKDLQNHLKTTGIQSDERKALIKRLENLIEDNFTVKTKIEPELTVDQRLAIAAGIKPIEPIPDTIIKKEVPEMLSATQANEAYFDLKGIAEDFGVNLENVGTMKSIISHGARKNTRAARAFSKATTNAKDAIRDVAEKAGLGEEYSGLNASYNELKNFQELFSKATKDEEAYQRFLNKRGSNANFAKQKVSQMIGEDVNKLGAKMQAVEIFSNPGWEIPAFGNSNTGRTMLAASLGGGAGYLIGRENEGNTFLPTMIGAALGSRSVSPIMLRKYMNANQLMRQAPSQVPGYKYLPYLMMNPNLHDQGE